MLTPVEALTPAELAERQRLQAELDRLEQEIRVALARLAEEIIQMAIRSGELCNATVSKRRS